MNDRFVSCVSFMALTLCLSPLASTAGADANLAALLQTGVDRGYPGVAMMTEGPDGVTQAAVAGSSDLEHHVPLHINDGFHVASITKTFTAASVLMLVDDGRLSIWWC